MISLRQIVLLVFFFNSCVYNVLSQETTIREINIVGNEMTRDFIIRREIVSRAGQPFHPENLEQDKNRLLNLGIFSEIEITADTVENSVRMLIFVRERFRLLPFPLMQYTEMDGFSYGGGVYHRNFTGRNQTVAFYALFGGNTDIYLTFYDPWIIGERVSFSVETAQLVRDHPFENFRQKEQFFTAELGKTWNYTFTCRIKTGYRQVESDTIGITRSEAYTDYLPFLKLTWIYDTRDVWVNSRSGVWAGGKLAQYGIPGKKPDFREITATITRYFPLRIGRTIGVMTSFGIRDGLIPPYERYYFGGAQSVRGLEPDYRRGSRILISGVEYRYDIITRKAIWENFDFGLGGVLFFDNGSVWNSGESLHDRRFDSGFGAGLRFFIPFFNEFRIDCGWTMDTSYRISMMTGPKF